MKFYLSNYNKQLRNFLYCLILASFIINYCLATKNPTTTSNDNSVASKQLKQVNEESHQKENQINPRQDATASSQPIADKKQGDQQVLPTVAAAAAAPTSAASSSSSSSSLAASTSQLQSDNTEEYVEIKPEEITSSETAALLAGKESDSNINEASISGSEKEQSAVLAALNAENKLAEDELNAHLAQDIISQQESGYNSFAALPASGSLAMAPSPRIASSSSSSSSYQPRQRQYQHHQHRPQQQSRSSYHHHQKSAASHQQYPMMMHPQQQQQQQQQHQSYNRGARSPLAYAPVSSSHIRMPPSYITLKGKLTGINSIISQYPYPAPGYPHHGPRHLPRGAAAGYAAFRDFVRAHANKYKHTSQQQSIGVMQPPPVGYSAQPQSLQTLPPPMSAYEPATIAAAAASPPPPPPSSGYSEPSSSGSYKPTTTTTTTKEAPEQQAYGQQGSYGVSKSNSYKTVNGQQKTKVTVAQAYIPHLTQQQDYSSSSLANYGNEKQQVPYTNPLLSRLYGNHAPHGVGKPEFNKDYGMVLHYPQATVYTEPMTVEQLHKLTGGGISQVIEQLQYNLANGYRDESNMIRSNNKHHIGNGITIHAKEYYAPGKSGQYVPTTAAVISTTGGGKNYNSQQYDQHQHQILDQSAIQTAAAPNGNYNSAGIQKPTELGSGYDRVKQAVANSSKGAAAAAAPANDYSSEKYHTKNNDYQQQSNSYDQSSKLHGNGEPLTSLTNLLGSELDSLYKANAALTKHLEPEIHSGIQAFQKSAHGKASLKYTEHDQHKSPLNLIVHHQAPTSGNNNYGKHQQQPQYQQQTNKYNNQYQQQQYGAQSHRQQHHRGARKQANRYHSGSRHQQQQNYQQQQQGAYRHHQQQQQQQQQQQSYQQNAYNAAEQALNQQMQQLLHDFQMGDEQYNGKNQPMINQGYPNKITQKYNQQQHQQQQQQQHHNQQQQSSYANHEGVEIPQGPNDQIGEIADLIEALKGSLESTQSSGGHQHGGKELASTNEYNHHQQQQQQSGGYSNNNNNNKHAETKLEGDVRYLASTLGQAPSYTMQVPVSHAVGGEQTTSAYDSGKKGSYEQQQQHQMQAYQQPQPVAYQQQPPQPQQHEQLPYQAPPQPIVEHQQQVDGYQQQQQQQQHHYHQQQQLLQPVTAQASYGAQSNQVYGQQQQQQHGGHDQHQQQQTDSYAYQQAMAGYGQQQAGGYGERQQQQQQQHTHDQQLQQQNHQQQQQQHDQHSGNYAGSQQQSLDYQQQAQDQYQHQQQQQQQQQQQAYGSDLHQHHLTSVAAPAVGLNSGYNAVAAAVAASTGQTIAQQPIDSGIIAQQPISVADIQPITHQSPAPIPIPLPPPSPSSQSSSSSYSTNEHSQVINHLVPATIASVPVQHSSTTSNNYESSQSHQPNHNHQHHHQQSHEQQQHQPINQIGLAAPTDAHYQQAQSLSSFVDSLPNDYQELLRQPAIVDNSNSANLDHLALLGHDSSSTSQSGLIAHNNDNNNRHDTAGSSSSNYHNNDQATSQSVVSQTQAQSPSSSSQQSIENNNQQQQAYQSIKSQSSSSQSSSSSSASKKS